VWPPALTLGMGCVQSTGKDASVGRSRDKAPATQPDAQPDVVTLATARLYHGFNLQHKEDGHLPEDHELEQQPFPDAMDNPDRLSPGTPTSSRDALSTPLTLHRLQVLPPRVSANGAQALPPEYTRQSGSAQSQPWHRKEASHPTPTATAAIQATRVSASSAAAAPPEAGDDLAEQDPNQPGSTRTSRQSMQNFFKGMLRLSKRRKLVRFSQGAARESEAGAGEEEACHPKQDAYMRHTNPGAHPETSSAHMQQHSAFLAHAAPPPNLNSYSAQSLRSMQRVSQSGSTHGGASTQGGSSFYKESFYKGSQYSFGGSLHGGSAFSNRSSPRTTPTSLTATSRALSALTHASSAQLSKRQVGASTSAGNANGQLSCSLAQQGQRAFSTSLIPGSSDGSRMLHTSAPGVDEIQTARGGVGKPGQFWSASVRNSNLSEDTSIPPLPLQEVARWHGYSEPGCAVCQSFAANAHSARGSPQACTDPASAAFTPPCPHQSNSAGCDPTRVARPSSLPISVQSQHHHLEHHHPPPPIISPASSFDRQPFALPPSRAASGLLLSSSQTADQAGLSRSSHHQQQGLGAPSEGSQHLHPHTSAHAPHPHPMALSCNISRRPSQALSFVEPTQRRSSVHRGPSVLFSKNDVQVTGLPPSLLISARSAQRQLSNSSSMTASSSGAGPPPINGPQASTPFRIRNHGGSVESPRVAQGGTSISGALALHDAMGPPGADTHSSAHSSGHQSSGAGARSPPFLLSTSSAQQPRRSSTTGAQGPPISSSCSHLPAHMLSPDVVGVGAGAGPKGTIAATAFQRVRSLDIARPPCIWETDQQHHDAAAAAPHSTSAVSPRKVVMPMAASRDSSSTGVDARAPAAMRVGDGHRWSADGQQRCNGEGYVPNSHAPMAAQHGPGGCACPHMGGVPRGHAASSPPGPLQPSRSQTFGSSDFPSGATVQPPSSLLSSPCAAHPAPPEQQPFQSPFPLQNSGAQVPLLAQQPSYPHVHNTPLPSVSPRSSTYGAVSVQVHPPMQCPHTSPWPHSLPLGDEACPVADDKLERARAEEALIAACRNALTHSSAPGVNSLLARVVSPHGSAPTSALHQQPNSSSQSSSQPSVIPKVPSLSTSASNLTAMASHPAAMSSSKADPAGSLNSSGKLSAGAALLSRHSVAKQVPGPPGKQVLANSGGQLPNLPSSEPGCETAGTHFHQEPHAAVPAQDVPPQSMVGLKRHLPPRCFSESNLSFRNRRNEEMARNARGKQPSTPEHALPCWVAGSSQAADGHMSLEPKRAHTYENSHANWAINSMPDALDEAYKVHVLGSSMGVDFVFDDEEEDGGMGLRGSSGSDEDEGGEVEFKYDMSGASRPEITLPSRFRSDTVGHQYPQPRSARQSRTHHQHTSKGNSRPAPTKHRSGLARPKKRESGSFVLQASGSAFSSGSGTNALNHRSSTLQSGQAAESSH